MKRKFIIIIILVLSLFGCKESESIEEKIDPTLSLISSSFIIYVDETAIIVPVIDGTDEELEIIYQPKDENIVEVVDGVITGISAGETTIVVSLKDYPEILCEAKVIVNMTDQQIANSILNWVKKDIGSVMLKARFFPTTHPDYDCTITYESSNKKVLTNEGLTFAKDDDQEAILTITVNYKDKIAQEDYKVIIGGNIAQEIANQVLDQFSVMIIRDCEIDTPTFDDPNIKVSWRSSNPEIFSNEGKYGAPFSDTVITIYALVIIANKGVVREYPKDITIRGKSGLEKIDKVRSWVLKQLNIEYLVKDNLELPVRYDDYNAELIWTTNNPNVITSTGVITIYETSQIASLTCLVKLSDESFKFTLEIEVVGKEYNDKWEAVDVLLDMIFKDEIKTQEIRFTGVGPTYVGYNNGYLPFYVNAQSVIIEDFFEGDNRPGTSYNKKWIVIHDTANNKEGANAEMHSRFIKTTDKASWHYTIDDQDIYYHIPNNEIAWHAATAEGNRYGIGIETCIHPGVDYNTVMRKTAKLASELMMKYDLTMYSIRQHNYFSGKDCPQVIRGAGRWDEMLELIQIEYFAKKYLQGVDFVWESLSPDILDNQGIIYNHLGEQTEVSYKVNVTYDGITKEFTHTSNLMPANWIN